VAQTHNFGLNRVQQSDLGEDADEKYSRHRDQYQAKAEVVLFLKRRCHDESWDLKDQATIRVASRLSLGGVSKVWKGAGEGTSHSKPSAASQGR
jgi:uncharacterized protein YfiM (DUF2279 family)